MRLVAILLPILFILSCGDGSDIPAEYLMVELVADREEVTAGQGFDLAVRRVWSKDLSPGEFGEDVLPPLRLRHDETVRRENDTHVEETRHYLAYAFTPGEHTVHAPSLAASPVLGGAELVVEGNRLDLTVNGTIDPEAPGSAELPGEPIKPGRFWLPALVVVLICVYLDFRRRSRRSVRPEPEPEPAPPPLEEKALVELLRLRALDPAGRTETQAFYREVTGILKGYLGNRFSIDAREMTTEELLVVGVIAEFRSSLSQVFGHCDLVKFAAHEPTGVERELMLDSAERLVRETSAP